jgi:glycosyltransferase involved in cell wall biosynthesis
MKFIVFGEDWARHPSSTQHLFKHIAKEHEVIWVNSIGMRTPSFCFKDIKRVFEKISTKLGFANPSQNKHPSTPSPVTVIEPQVLPWHGIKLIQRINRFLLSRQIKKHIVDQGEICYWVSVPTAEYLVPSKPKKLVYYIGDDFSGLAGVDYNLVQPFEDNLLQRANLVFVCSEALKEKFKMHTPVLLNHGVDVDMFSRGCFDNFFAYAVPTVGFYGSLNSWLDIELIRHIAVSRPHIRIELIGHIDADLGSILALDNVFHKPAVPHHELPKHLQSWNVAMLPFKDCAQIRACNPLKLREYLASGTPVVSTRYKAVEQFSEQVFIADSASEFVSHIDHACHLKEVVRGWVDWQQKAVKQESWLVKATDVLNKIG